VSGSLGRGRWWANRLQFILTVHVLMVDSFKLVVLVTAGL